MTTGSQWLAANLASVIVAVAQAGATLSSSTAEDTVSQADTDSSKEGNTQ